MELKFCLTASNGCQILILLRILDAQAPGLTNCITLFFSHRHLQFFGLVLRVSGRRGSHHDGDQGQAHQVQLHVLHLLPVRLLLQHRVPQILQAGKA